MTLIARDFSSVSDRVLRCALALAARTGARLHILHAEVLHDHQTSSEERRSPTEGIDGLRNTLKEEGTLSAEALEDVTIVDAVRRDVAPASAILRYAAEEAMDLVVRGKLESFVDQTKGPDVATEIHVGPGKVASAITEFVEEHSTDLVCMSTHGRTGLERFFMGSVAEKVVRHVRCPVLTVKAFGSSLVEGTTEERAAVDA